MAIRVSSLEEFFELYKDARVKKNAPYTLSEYMRLENATPYRDYTDTVRSALSARARAGGGYGSEADALGRAGLTDDGYRQYLEARANRSLEGSLAHATREKADTYTENLHGYEKYLASFDKKQTNLKNSVRNFLMENEIFNIEDTYSIGLNRGLSADEAAELSLEIYQTRRNWVYANTLIAILGSDLDVEGAKEYARSMGLIEEDVNRMAARLNGFMKDPDRFGSEEYLKYIESLANK